MDVVRNSSDLVIVSIYGRGHWLALETARRGWKTTLIDLTAACHEYAPEDWEGPWGFFDAPEISPSQRSYLLESGTSYPVAHGFTTWLSSGPIEMTGPISQFQAKAAGVHDDVLDYVTARTENAQPVAAIEVPRKDQPVWVSSMTLKGLQTPDPLKGLSRMRERVKALPFTQNWLGGLAHSIASIAWDTNTDTLDFHGPLPLKSPFGVRHLSQETIDKDFARMQSAGVKVIRTASLYDVRVQSGHFESVLIDDGAREEKARSVVWTLSSNETDLFHERVNRSLYPGGPLKPDWMWVRYRLKLANTTSAKGLPLAFTVLENVFLPWTHANLLCAKRLRTKDESVRLDIWARLPARVLGDREYIEKTGREIVNAIGARVPLSNPELEALPTEATMGRDKQKCLRYPLFEKEILETLQTVSAKNLFMAGPEQWCALDWNTQMQYQAEVFAALERMKAHWENVQRRQEASR